MPPTPTRALLAVAVVVAVAACGGDTDVASPGATPSEPVGASTSATPEVGPTATEGVDDDAAGTCLAGATECADNPSGGPPPPAEGTPVEPREGLVDVVATPWEAVAPVDEDQVVLEVAWTGGNPTCFGLDRVDVDEGEDAVTITVFTGQDPEVDLCTMEAVYTSTRVELSEPLGPRSILDGAAT